MRFSRPYERVEMVVGEPDPVRVELDLSSVQPIDDTIPFALDPVATLESEPYAMVEVGLTIPAVAELLITETPLPATRTNFLVVLMVALIMICAFAGGMGVVLAVGN